MPTRKLSEETSTSTVDDDDIVLVTKDPFGAPISRTVPAADLRTYMQLGLTAAITGAVPLNSAVRNVTSNTTVTPSDSGGTIVVTDLGAGVAVDFPATLPLGTRVRVIRIATDPDPGNAVTYTGSGGGSHLFYPFNNITRLYQVDDLIKVQDGGLHVWSVNRSDTRDHAVRTVAASTTVTGADDGGTLLVLGLAAPINIDFPAELAVGTSVRVVRIPTLPDAGNAVTYSGSGAGTHVFEPYTEMTRTYQTDVLVKLTGGAGNAWNILRGELPPTGLGEVAFLNSDTTLDDTYSGKTIFVDTTTPGVPVVLTVADYISAGWECSVVRQGLNGLTIQGAGLMVLSGPASSLGTVSIEVDDGGVSLARRSATETWAVGVTTQEGLGSVVLLTSSTMLTDAHTGKTIFVDTTSGVITLTIADDVSEGWECVVIREGANNLVIDGETLMTLGGPASSGGTVTIAVDDGGVSLLRRSTTKTWAAGVIA